MWIGWICKLCNTVPLDLLFQRLFVSPLSSPAFCTRRTTGNGGSKSTTLNELQFPFLETSFLPEIAQFGAALLLLPQPLAAAVDTDAAVGAADLAEAEGEAKRFLLEKNFFNLKYPTLALFPFLLLRTAFLVVIKILWEIGRPATLLFRLTWPKHPILGDKGSPENDSDRSRSHFGCRPSLIAGFEQSMGRNTLFWRRFLGLNRLYLSPILISASSNVWEKKTELGVGAWCKTMASSESWCCSVQ